MLCLQCYIHTQVLRRLILFGSPSDAKSLRPVATVSTCVPPMVVGLQQLVALRTRAVPPRPPGSATAPRAPLRSQLLAMLDRGILKLAKSQCQIQEAHPWSYFSAHGALRAMLEFCCDQVGRCGVGGVGNGKEGGGGVGEWSGVVERAWNERVGWRLDWMQGHAAARSV